MAIAETLFTVCLSCWFEITYHTCLILGFVSILFTPRWLIHMGYTNKSPWPVAPRAGPTNRHQGDEKRFRCLFQNPLPGYHRSTVSLYQVPAPVQRSSHTANPPKEGSDCSFPSPSGQRRLPQFLAVSLHLARAFVKSSFIPSFKLAIYLLLGPWQIKEIYIVSNVVSKGDFITVFTLHDFGFAWFKLAWEKAINFKISTGLSVSVIGLKIKVYNNLP